MEAGKLLSALREAARRAGEAALSVREQGLGGEVVGIGKSGDATLRGDLAAERAAVEYIVEKLGDVVIISEEMGVETAGRGDLTVVIDPIDGSRNYKRGSPLFTVSIAAATGTSLDSVVAGVIYAPALGLEVYAVKGGGAYANGRRISVKASERGDLVFVGASPKASFLPYAFMLELSKRGLIARSLGAASYEMASVALGAADGYIDAWGTMRVVDIAAAYLVVREAGGWVSAQGRMCESPCLSLQERLSIVAAATGSLGAELLDALREALGFSLRDPLSRG
ncbi:MAG: inositol monophosphatase [Thermofilum sp.]